MDTPPLPRDMLAAHLLRLFEQLEATNARRRSEIRTATDWEVERCWLLDRYRQMLGRFPERTPLNPRLVSTIERQHYTIEKLLYESQPGLLVTALAYVPRSRMWPVPGVLVPCGHTENGKAGETYQRACAGLAGKGYFVLTYDPLGQGERKLYWNAEQGADPRSCRDDVGAGNGAAVAGRSDIGGCTTEHSYVGNQCFLLGISVAQYMIWDSIRGIDYLQSRPEVDPERIAIAGNSGGGTNTAYTAPLDERIKVAVPCCYITTFTWRRRSWTTGDAEQDLVGQLAAGLDHADLLRLVAPRPLLVGSAALDYFPLEGARESVAIARELYATLGAGERIAHAVAEAPHGYSIELRRATYRWLNRWFDKEEEGDEEPETVVESDADLQCTPGGQVALLGSKTPFTLNLRRLEAPQPGRARSVKEAILQFTAFESTGQRPAARPPDTQLFRTEGLRRIETVRLWPEIDVAVPGLAYAWRDGGQQRRALLWVDGAGKEVALEGSTFRTALNRLLPEGWLVLAIDVRGVGETAPRPTGRANPEIMGAEALLTYESFVAGKPLFGMRLRDIVCAVNYLTARPDVAAAAGVTLVGWGAGGLLGLHAAALDERVSALAAINTLASYRSLVAHEHYAHHVSSFIPGVVATQDSPDGYEVDDVAALVTPRPLLRLRPVDHMNAPLTAETDDDVSSALLGWLQQLPVPSAEY